MKEIGRSSLFSYGISEVQSGAITWIGTIENIMLEITITHSKFSEELNGWTNEKDEEYIDMKNISRALTKATTTEDDPWKIILSKANKPIA